MCGPPNEEYRKNYNTYEVQVRLDRYYSYQLNHKSGETEEEYYKRLDERLKKQRELYPDAPF